MAANEDEETQKKGMVAVFLRIGKNRAMDFVPRGKILPALTRALPFRYSAIHFCDDDTNSSQMITIPLLVVASHVRARFRIHKGESCECQ